MKMDKEIRDPQPGQAGATPLELALAIRPLEPMYREDVLRIERAAFGEAAWRRKDFSGTLGLPAVEGRVAVVADRTAGYVIFHRARRAVEILNLAVDRPFRRAGIGRRLVEHVLARAACPERTAAQRLSKAYVRESNLPALRFFRGLGFVAAATIRRYYDLSDDDAILLIFRAEWTQERD